MNIGDGLRRTATQYPDKVGIIDRFAKFTTVTQYTWKEFNEQVNRFANALTSLGLKKGERMGIYSETRSQFAIAQHAFFKLGVVLIPLNTAYIGEELVHMINDSEPMAMVVDADRKSEINKIRDKIPSVKFVIGIGPDHGFDYDFDTLRREQPVDEPDVEVGMDDLSCLLYTSGTTGAPKGAMMTQGNWVFTSILLSAEWRIFARHRFLCPLAPFFSGGVMFATLAAFRGMTLIMCNWDTEKIMRVIQDDKVSYTMMAPAMTSMIVKHPKVKEHDFSSMERIITSAAPISPALLREASKIFGDVYTFTYGTSETGLAGCQLYPEDVALEGPLSQRIASVGKAMMGMRVDLVDDDGNPVPIEKGQRGELVVTGPTVGNAYWKRPDAVDLKDGKWYSGDIGEYDEDGYIYIVDRKKDMILSGGANIYPREIEDVLYAHPAVMHCAVVGIPNEQWGESVKGFVVLREGAAVTEKELIEFCREHLAEYKKPRAIEFRDKLPMNPSGKILKRVLRDDAWKGQERRV
ncbi:MAG: AMP-binding protein [Deltaproteobacteria bacterium]|nr:AMP-binding protein [Deltaproteobacteria bacterium]